MTGYTVHECAAEVNDLRKALGYEKVVLIGQSFGGQWTFTTLRLFPQIVARAIISGVEPLDLGYDMPSHVYGAMRRQWYTAEQDPKIQRARNESRLVTNVREGRRGGVEPDDDVRA